MATLVNVFDPEFAAKLNDMRVKIIEGYHTAESTRKYLLWTGIITTILVMIPLAILFFALPQFLATYGVPIGNIGL